MDTNHATPVPERSPDELTSLRERLVLHHIREQNGGLTPTELSRKVAASEADRSVDSASGDGSDIEDLTADVYDSIHRTQLPTLVDRGRLEYDEGTNLISLVDRTEDGHDSRCRLHAERHRKALYYAIPAVSLACVLMILEFGIAQSSERARWWVSFAGAATLVLLASSRYVLAARRLST